MKGSNFTALNSFIDLMFLCDIIISFRTSFYDMDTGDEVYEPKRIGKVYLRGRFTIDLLSTIPFDTIASIFTDDTSPLFQLVSLLKLVRITRLGRMIERMNVK